MLTGLWALKMKTVIAFTATTSPAHERVVHNCIAPPLVLRFSSEYELIHGISPVQSPNIITCKDESTMFSILATDIDKMYDRKPIIVVYEKSQEKDVKSIVNKEKYRYCMGVERATLINMKYWDYGILMLEG
jgi:hypothetical protein